MTITVSVAKANKALEAGKYHIVYTAPAGCVSATVNARMVSRNLAVDSKTRMAIVAPGFVDGGVTPPGNETYVQPVDLILGPGGITVGMFEDSAIVLAPGESIVMYSDTANVAGRVHGFVRTNA